MNASVFYFWLLALITAGCAIAVVVSQNIVRAAAYLLFTLVGTGGLFFLLGADFVGSTQLIVYVGGILVLVVFGVMLTAQGPFVTLRTNAVEWAVGVVVGLLLLSVMVLSLWNFKPAGAVEATVPAPENSPYAMQLGQGFLGLPVGPRQTHGETGASEVEKRTSYFLPFELVSVHLLVVLIGAAYLARAKRRKERAS